MLYINYMEKKLFFVKIHSRVKSSKCGQNFQWPIFCTDAQWCRNENKVKKKDLQKRTY